MRVALFLLVLLLSGCGTVSPAPSSDAAGVTARLADTPSAAVAAPPRSSEPTSTLAAVSVAGAAVSAPTQPAQTVAQSPRAPQPAAAAGAPTRTMWIANTGGVGVYVRATPNRADRLRAYADGTSLQVLPDEVDGDGEHWLHVRTQDGLEGYVPAMYVSDHQPAGETAAVRSNAVPTTIRPPQVQPDARPPTPTPVIPHPLVPLGIPPEVTATATARTAPRTTRIAPIIPLQPAATPTAQKAPTPVVPRQPLPTPTRKAP